MFEFSAGVNVRRHSRYFAESRYLLISTPKYTILGHFALLQPLPNGFFPTFQNPLIFPILCILSTLFSPSPALMWFLSRFRYFFAFLFFRDLVEHWRRTKRPKKNFEKKIATTIARRGGKKWPILSPKLSVKNKMKTNKTRYKMYSWTPKTTLE